MIQALLLVPRVTAVDGFEGYGGSILHMKEMIIPSPL